MLRHTLFIKTYTVATIQSYSWIVSLYKYKLCIRVSTKCAGITEFKHSTVLYIDKYFGISIECNLKKTCMSGSKRHDSEGRVQFEVFEKLTSVSFPKLHEKSYYCFDYIDLINSMSIMTSPCIFCAYSCSAITTFQCMHQGQTNSGRHHLESHS
jgi:hypothetical protein